MTTIKGILKTTNTNKATQHKEVRFSGNLIESSNTSPRLSKQRNSGRQIKANIGYYRELVFKREECSTINTMPYLVESINRGIKFNTERSTDEALSRADEIYKEVYP